jgi:hypothetical protein
MVSTFVCLWAARDYLKGFDVGFVEQLELPLQGHAVFFREA